MQTVFNITLIVLAAILVVAIVLQQRGAGLGTAFGGEGGVFTSRRGAEKILFVTTIVVAILFFGTALLNLLLA